MKTIYKSIELEAALLSVTLALQAEIKSEGETVTADVQASTLDRLRVTLVSPNVSGARDLVASGNATIEGNEIAVNLENLAFGTHRLVVSARFGTQIRTLYALDISVPQAELPNETQEYEDTAIVVSTYGDGGGGGEFPTDYAKQGDDPTATLTDTQAYAQSAAEDAAAAKTAAEAAQDAAQAIVIPSDYSKQGTDPDATNTAILAQATAAATDAAAAKGAAQALSPIAQAAEAYNEGKPALATAITNKGVQAASTDSLAEMATKVSLIAQEPIIWNDGDISHMYEKQMFGSLETPDYWNLYEILAYLLSDHYLRKDAGHIGERFGGFLLAEYYRGYPDIALSGAGTGGAYVVSDIDHQTGEFKVYYTDTTHTWDTEFDGKGNRWVAYCFVNEYHDFQITDTDTSPRSIFIGRKVGTINCLVATRIANIVVPDGNELYGIGGNTSRNWDKKIVLRNIGDGGVILGSVASDAIYVSGKKPVSGMISASPSPYVPSIVLDFTDDTITPTDTVMVFIHNNTIGTAKTSCIVVRGKNLSHSAGGAFMRGGLLHSLVVLDFEKISWTGGWEAGILYYSIVDRMIISVEEMTSSLIFSRNSQVSHLILNYKTNDKSKSVIFSSDNYNAVASIEIMDGWCKPLNISKFDNLTKADVQAHIFDRLGVNDLSTGAVTLTLATAVLGLFTQEEIDAVVARTNITIVGA